MNASDLFRNDRQLVLYEKNASRHRAHVEIIGVKSKLTAKLSHVSFARNIGNRLQLIDVRTIPSELLGGVAVRASDLRSSGRGFDSRPGRYRAT